MRLPVVHWESWKFACQSLLTADLGLVRINNFKTLSKVSYLNQYKQLPDKSSFHQEKKTNKTNNTYLLLLVLIVSCSTQESLYAPFQCAGPVILLCKFGRIISTWKIKVSIGTQRASHSLTSNTHLCFSYDYNYARFLAAVYSIPDLKPLTEFPLSKFLYFLSYKV